ncbi:MAG TPA: trehalose-phosphatase [Rudaea sp.]|nr:trehalose-phosphatase [Rudaea sp.]
MKQILARANIGVLQRFVRSDTLIALDYDGTLAPIVSDPARAQMRPSTRALLASVAQRYATIVITGRAREDASRLLAGVELREIIGNHGAETQAASPASVARRLASWRAELRKNLEGLAGAAIEDKGYSLAIHYRACSNRTSAAAKIRKMAAALPGARLVGGKCVLNVVPIDAADKGAALLRAWRRLRCPRALYVGDDDTDEDVFALDRPDHLLGIRVGSRRGSRADYALRGQGEIDRLLAFIAAAPGGVFRSA